MKPLSLAHCRCLVRDVGIEVEADHLHNSIIVIHVTLVDLPSYFSFDCCLATFLNVSASKR